MFIPNPKYSAAAGGVNPVEKHRYIETIALNERAIDRYDKYDWYMCIDLIPYVLGEWWRGLPPPLSPLPLKCTV